MTSSSKRIAPARVSDHNHVGLLAWSLLAYPQININRVGGIPGQPDPDSPNEQPDEPTDPTEPGVPTLPDEAPPKPVV
ncbi:hypothetical protein QN400_19490 [Pseudomonas sp. RTC3]|uniref:hypothetical protein n=1 Tax=unclassified Pseudomonas TaxID=196821 RepID=UPI002AB3D3B6|nr:MULTISPECIES: hypothetical protein [unclassified Pseudomonas]MEB0064198.1 hypothetical protein [Pseudomonas sp. RTC3]MDY7566167.1 hypothetical protein [Pseudomonas sp. 5C2]MEB0005697.1 hypothetical protein [Pseudomonas sp. RTB2]MEB0016783.1 hypothetical protein [Pseudomonas sp. RTB3]MEB0024695.1 hypothetical protein [Pseudomonas sp. MH9.2]